MVQRHFDVKSRASPPPREEGAVLKVPRVYRDEEHVHLFPSCVLTNQSSRWTLEWGVSRREELRGDGGLASLFLQPIIIFDGRK